jgi:hypothetical protein
MVPVAMQAYVEICSRTRNHIACVLIGYQYWQVWNLEQRRIASSLQWESNVTAFSIIFCSSYMYVGDEYGMVYVLKYDAEEVKLVPMPYHVPADVAAGNDFILSWV